MLIQYLPLNILPEFNETHAHTYTDKKEKEDSIFDRWLFSQAEEGGVL